MKSYFQLFCLSFLLCPPSYSIEPTGSFFIGSIRSDGILVPFALYDSGKWSSPWPGYFDRDPRRSLNDTTITSLSRIPSAWAGSQKKIPTRWWKPTAKGDSSITVTKPVIIHSYCVELWALLISGGKPSEDPSRGVPYTGIAASVQLPISPVTTLRPNTKEWEELIRFIESSGKEKISDTTSPLPGKAKPVTKINASLFRTGQAVQGEYYYSYDIEKLIFLPKSNQNGYTGQSLNWRGLIRRNRAGELIFIQNQYYRSAEFPLSDIDLFISPPRDIPRGMFTLGDKMYWIFDDYPGHESEARVIYEVDQKGVTKVIDFYMGGC